jgi:hypothetical protein
MKNALISAKSNRNEWLRLSRQKKGKHITIGIKENIVINVWYEFICGDKINGDFMIIDYSNRKYDLNYLS